MTSENLFKMVAEIGRLIAFDMVFFVVLLLLILPMAAFRVAAYAVLKRNFKSYFSNPTGYVFLCLFVALTALAAFWPNEFFTSNLANLEQLNKYFPFIMLVFIPAITMSIWAEERRQGTDELLLTLPALDFDIVLGKYTAAAATFTVSLIFSQIANFFVLLTLAEGDLDTGLYFTTYLGYWFMGLAMLAVGMVASFLTNNLTVGFILGAMFNAPLVFAIYANVIVPDRFRPPMITRWSFTERFDDFGRGVIAFSSFSYFLMLIVLGIYLSMVFIGRRHWMGGREGGAKFWHYVLRTLSMVAILIAVNVFASNKDWRFDTTEGQVSSLSPDTKTLLANIGKETKQPIYVYAYISARVPDEYIKTRYNLISMLKELKRYGGSEIILEMHDSLEEFSPEAVLAEETYGIRRQVVTSQTRGEIRQEQIIMGAAFKCGLERVVVPFFSSGVPVEYEIVRAACTVASQKRKKLGIVKTDAELNGGFSFAGGMPRQTPKLMLLEDLQRQYRTEDIDISTPMQVLDENGNLRFDAILVVQPSSLNVQQITNLVTAINEGQPAAIFEDPMVQFFDNVVGTADDKPAPGGGMFGGGAPPQPKGDSLKMLWKALGIEPVGPAMVQGKLPGNVVCQPYLPYPRFRDQVPPIGPLVFVGGEGGTFNADEPAVKDFQEVFFAFAGGIKKAADSKLKFSPLAETSDQNTSLIDAATFRDKARTGDMLELQARTTNRNNVFTLAAWIRGNKDGKAAEEDSKKEADEKEKKEDDKKDAKKPTPPLNVVYVCDIDILGNQFVEMRNTPPAGENFRWNNVPFVLNLIDGVAGDDRFLAIRQREVRYFTLRQLEKVAQLADEKQTTTIAEYKADYDKAVKEEEDEVTKLNDEYTKFQEDLAKSQGEGTAIDFNEQLARARSMQLKSAVRAGAAEVKKKELQLDLNKKREEIRRERDMQIQSRQNDVKLWAAFLPPIPPLLVGFFVYTRRLLREREGISKSRMR